MAETINAEVASTSVGTTEQEPAKKAPRTRISVTDILEKERAGWHERHRGVLVKHNKNLGHPLVTRTFDRYFEKMSQYLYFIPVMGRILIDSKQHNDIKLVEKAITKVMQESIAKLDVLIGQYQAVMEARGFEQFGYNKNSEVEVSLASPLDKMYFTVLEKADLCLMLNYNLWVENALHPDYDKNEQHRTENEWEVKVLLREVIRVVVANFRRILNHINRQQRSGKTTEADVGDVAQAPAKSKAKTAIKTDDTSATASGKKAKSQPVELATAAAA